MSTENDSTLTRNTNARRSTKNMLFYWEVSNSSRRTLEKALSRFQKRCSLCPLVHVCAAHPIRNCWSPQTGDAVSSFGGPCLPGDQGMFLALCHVLKAWGKLGFLSISFLQQIFVDFILCPHHSSPSCQGRQACG